MKSLVGKKAHETKTPIQQLYGVYAMDRLILKLSKTEFSNNLIVKGGFLLTTDLGVSMRTTRDLDFTLQNITLNEGTINELLNFIEDREENDNEYFEFKSIDETRGDFNYNGYNLKLIYHNGTTEIPINVDITSGEDIISVRRNKRFKSIFNDEEYMINSYPMEQVISDKFYALLAYGSVDDTNSRMKDYYDLYLLTRIVDNLDLDEINLSLDKTMNQRDNYIETDNYDEIIDYLSGSENQKDLWTRYASKSSYAEGLTFEEVMNQVRFFSNELVQQRLEKNRQKRLDKNDNFEL